MDRESINLGFLLITDRNLHVILNDPDITMAIKNLIVKMATDRLFVSKLSNPIQKDDFQYEAKKSYLADKKDLYDRFYYMLETFKIRGRNINRFISYYNYLKKKL
jgi:hypothetical protein